MSPVIKNILVSIGGFILGNMANFATLILGSKIIPIPPEINLSDPNSFIEHGDKLTIGNYIVALSAHSIGTLVAAYFICRLVTTKEKVFALVTGLVFLMLGIMNLQSLPHPTWFAVVDLIIAYIPMALLGYFLAMKTKTDQASI